MTVSTHNLAKELAIPLPEPSTCTKDTCIEDDKGFDLIKVEVEIPKDLSKTNTPSKLHLTNHFSLLNSPDKNA